ncbi:hypothetical protein CH289_05780 [Rhodococcus sp. RS1C4]|nr:hypothetical protein CH289_05780 [Rhodococcus sp. RS1C4]OZC60452.1 hypothetical protein CH267_04900 [Rhodococcus sp. 06-621-2]OZC78609.1 hypothetical protein CH282_22025 [Rhodococcus sp. 06-418-1B]OZE85134.1 hypothetical protein CH304_07300 [Rhodococcus sp. 15-649-1-2]
MVRVDAVFEFLLSSSPVPDTTLTTTKKATSAPHTFQIVPVVFLSVPAAGATWGFGAANLGAPFDDLGSVDAVH